MEGVAPRRGPAPLMAKKWLHVTDCTILIFNFQKLVGTPPRRGLVSR
ncbi:hypothetical protein MTR67_002507 [Solanum verrucosum]|uniref:Uncharacterized protein n=1 Tax=Solanum verrucosum TaxID=315347 RepID=A0AAF0PR48_SOLVR|nr:hypothetical protein MTR67_002507 [Solanum verrucosum]